MKNKKFKSLIEFTGFLCLYYSLKIWPYAFTKRLLLVLAWFAGSVLKIRYKGTTNRLKNVFKNKSDAEIKALYKKIYKNLACTLAELYFMPLKKLKKNTKLIGYENIEKALELNKGVVLVSAHYGNWETFAITLSEKAPFSAIMTEQRNPYFNNFTVKTRQNFGYELIYKKNSMRNILKALKNNRLVAFLTDQAAGRNGILLNFLGNPASVHTGFAKIALKTGAPIVFLYSKRINNELNIMIDKPIFVDEEKDNYIELTKEMNKKLEEVILDKPEQWFWLHNRWKKTHLAKKID